MFPGGATWFNETGGYGEVGQTLYDLALETNQKGVYYPVFGICLGMELLGQVAIGGQEIRAHCSASKLPLALNFEDGGFKKLGGNSHCGEVDFELLVQIFN